MRFIWAGLGGAVGPMLRYGVGLWFSGGRFPWAPFRSMSSVHSLSVFSSPTPWADGRP